MAWNVIQNWVSTFLCAGDILLASCSFVMSMSTRTRRTKFSRHLHNRETQGRHAAFEARGSSCGEGKRGAFACHISLFGWHVFMLRNNLRGELSFRKRQAFSLREHGGVIPLLDSLNEKLWLRVFLIWPYKQSVIYLKMQKRIILNLLTDLLARDWNCWMYE